MKRLVKQTIDATIIPKKQQALDTLDVIKQIYKSDTSGLLKGNLYSEFMDEIDTQVHEIQSTQ